jgi:hypothetical protein
MVATVDIFLHYISNKIYLRYLTPLYINKGVTGLHK